MLTLRRKDADVDCSIKIEIWGNKNCRRCQKFYEQTKERGLNVVKIDFEEDDLQVLWVGNPVKATEIRAALDFQDFELPVIYMNTAYTFNEYERWLNEY